LIRCSRAWSPLIYAHSDTPMCILYFTFAFEADRKTRRPPRKHQRHVKSLRHLRVLAVCTTHSTFMIPVRCVSTWLRAPFRASLFASFTRFSVFCALTCTPSGSSHKAEAEKDDERTEVPAASTQESVQASSRTQSRFQHSIRSSGSNKSSSQPKKSFVVTSVVDIPDGTVV
jgi:hypothetical protein